MPKEAKSDNDKSLHNEYNETMLRIKKSLNEIWDRIGFNQETKLLRLEKFYQKCIVSEDIKKK